MSMYERWVVIAVIVLNAYSLGANCVERFVNYQSWPRLAGADFAAYHRAQQPWILGFVVGPLGLGLVCQVLLLVSRAKSVPFWSVLMLIAASLAGFACTVLIQIPIHRQLDQGYSPGLVARLLATDWIRKSADLGRLIALLALLQGVIA